MLRALALKSLKYFEVRILFFKNHLKYVMLRIFILIILRRTILTVVFFFRNFVVNQVQQITNKSSSKSLSEPILFHFHPVFGVFFLFYKFCMSLFLKAKKKRWGRKAHSHRAEIVFDVWIIFLWSFLLSPNLSFGVNGPLESHGMHIFGRPYLPLKVYSHLRFITQLRYPFGSRMG